MKIISDIEIIDNILCEGEYIVDVDNKEDEEVGLIEGSFYVIKYNDKFYYIIVDVLNSIISEGIRCFEMGFIFKNKEGGINFDIDEKYVIDVE